MKHFSVRTIMHFFTTILLAIVCSNSFAQRVIPLYGANIPNSQNINAEDQINADKSVYYRIVDPSLIVYLPSRQSPNNKTAVIICPGGGYATLQIKREGYDIAEAFNRIGVTAFILKYRLPDDKTNTDKTVAPLQDAQQAIKMVRDSAAKWNLDQGKIGIMGFSAGGHLASSAGVHYKDVLIDNATKKTLCPDFMLLVYPVISFGEAYGHIGSRDNLIGKNPSADLIKYFSNELHADQNTPPTFLVHAGDDNIVPVANSIKFYEALQKNGVNAELHIYAKGGHGFGSIPTFEEWFGRCLQWMRTAQLIQ